jgi:hypothetical protein
VKGGGKEREKNLFLISVFFFNKHLKQNNKNDELILNIKRFSNHFTKTNACYII